MNSVFRLWRNLLLGCLTLLALGGCFASARAQDKAQTKKDPNAKKKEGELKSVYKTWIEEDVSIIITEEEIRGELGRVFKIVWLREFRFDADAGDGKRFLGWSCLVRPR